MLSLTSNLLSVKVEAGCGEREHACWLVADLPCQADDPEGQDKSQERKFQEQSQRLNSKRKQQQIPLEDLQAVQRWEEKVGRAVWLRYAASR